MSEKFRRVPEDSARGYISRRRADLVMDRSKAAERNLFIDQMMSGTAKNDTRGVRDDSIAGLEEFESLKLGEIVERVRIEAGMSRVDLSRKASLHYTSVFMIETGRTKRPSKSVIADIASGLGLEQNDPRLVRIKTLREQEAELMKQRRSKK